MQQPSREPSRRAEVQLSHVLALAASVMALALLGLCVSWAGVLGVAVKDAFGRQGAPASLSALPLPKYLERPWRGKTMPDDALARGMTYQGTGEALKRFARRMIEGQPSTVVYIGGSVTTGRGATRDELGYPALVAKWLRSSFPASSLTILNNAMGGTTSGLAASCTDHFVPQNASLVIIEFSINDIRGLKLHHPQRAAFEMLLRNLRARPRPPAVLLLHHWCWHIANKEAGKDPNVRGLYDEPDTEFDLALIGQYYNIPSISVRAAAWPLFRQGVPPFLVDGFRQDKFFVDPCHPSDHGHQSLADLLIHAIQSAAAWAYGDQLVEQTGAAGLVSRHLLQPLGQRARQMGTEQPQRGQRQQRGQRGGEQQQEWLPPPFQEGVRDDFPPALCMLGDEFEKAVVDTSGWKWTPDFPNKPTRAAQKWSWTGSQVGDWADLLVDTRDRRKGKRQDESNMTSVYLGYLRSFTNMGVATVTCEAGCTCQETLLDGHWSNWFSMVQGHEVWASRHPECRLRVKVAARPMESMNETGEGVAGRVILRSLVVSSAPLVMGD